MEVKIGDFLKFKQDELYGFWKIVDIERNNTSKRYSFIVIERKEIDTGKLNIIKLPYLYVVNNITTDYEHFQNSSYVDLIFYVKEKILVGIKVHLNPNHNFIPTELEVELKPFFADDHFIYAYGNEFQLNRIIQSCNKFHVKYDEQFQSIIDNYNSI